MGLKNAGHCAVSELGKHVVVNHPRTFQRLHIAKRHS